MLRSKCRTCTIRTSARTLITCQAAAPCKVLMRCGLVDMTGSLTHIHIFTTRNKVALNQCDQQGLLPPGKHTESFAYRGAEPPHQLRGRGLIPTEERGADSAMQSKRDARPRHRAQRSSQSTIRTITTHTSMLFLFPKAPDRLRRASMRVDRMADTCRMHEATSSK